MIRRFTETDRLEKRLYSTGRQIYRQRLLRGMVLLTTVALVAITLFFIADYLTRFPYPIRLLVLLVGVTATYQSYRRFFVEHPERDLDAQAVSLRLERRHPELQDRLISTLQFQDQQQIPSGTSSNLVEGLCRQTFERAPGLPLAELVDRSWMRPAGKRLLIAAAVLLALAVLAPVQFLTFTGRMLLPGIEYPTATRISEVRIPELLPAGDPIMVEVIGEGELPELGQIRLVASGQDEVSLDLLPVAETPGMYRTELPPLLEAMSMQVHLGDADTWYRDLTPEPRPGLAELTVTVTSPVYTGIEQRQERSGNLRVIRGSSLDWHFTFDKSVRVCRLEPRQTGDAAIMEAEHQEDGSWQLQMTADESVGLRLQVVDEHGLTPRDPPVYRISAVTDQPPSIHVAQPRGVAELAPASEMPLSFTVSDDFGIDRVLLEYVVENESDSVGLRAVPPDRRRRYRVWEDVANTAFAFDGVWSNQELDLRPGQILRIWIAAEDRAPEPQRAESSEITIRIISSEEYRRLLWQRLGDTVQRIDELVPEIKSSDRQLERIQGEL